MRRFGVLLVVLMLAAVPASAQRLLGTTGQGGGTSTLVELDPATGALVSTIGDVGYLVNGMTWDASSGTLWATTSTNDATFPNGLITIDPMTAAGTPVGAGAGQLVNVPASNSAGQVYGWTENSDDAVLWDTAAGTITVLGDAGISTGAQGLAFDPADMLYLVNFDGVYTIDTGTGAATYAGDIGTWAHHGDFHPISGLYYGIDVPGGGAKNLVVADLSSFTVVDTIPTVDNLHTLTFVTPRLFGTTGQGGGTSTLVELDPATGELISTIGDVGYLVNGLTWDARSRTLYATTSQNDANFPSGLITIDAETAVGTPIGAGSGLPDSTVMAASNAAGQVYSWWDPDQDDLLIYDTLTGLATLVGESGIGTGAHGLSFNPADVLYLVNSGGSVYTIDTTTGAATYVGDIGTTAHHGDFEPTSGLYYGIDVPGGGAKNLVVADLSSFAVVETIATIDDLHTLTFFDPVESAAQLEFDPGFLESRLYPGGSEDQALSVLNYGRTDANVLLIAQQSSGWVPSGPMDVIMAPTAAPEHLDDADARMAVAPERVSAAPLAAGDVFQTWGSGLAATWGIAFNTIEDTVWAGEGWGDDTIHEYLPDGSPTGTQWPFTWNPANGPADYTYDSLNNRIWVMHVETGNTRIYEIDPATGVTGNFIGWAAPSSERGVAFDPVTDTFFVGGWNTLAVSRIDRAGNILQVANLGLPISGLAYNPVSEHLFVMTNASPSSIYVLDVADSYNVIGSFGIPGFSDFGGAGLGISCDGHLWAVDQQTEEVYEFDSGEPTACLSGVSLPWLMLTPNEGLVPADGMGPGELPINAEFIADGLDHYGLVQARIQLLHDAEGEAEDATVCFTKPFYDVGAGYWADEYIHSAAGARITGGCGYGDFCPTDTMLRHVMALWLVKLIHGPDFSPPPCTGIFEDVVCESTPNSDYIEQLYADGVTTGCSQDPLLFCPDSAVNRAQMAVFILRALEGPGYVPPPCVGIFDDVACPAFWAADYIEDLYALGITTGCSQTPPLYCPGNPTNRAQMSAFVQRAWDLPMCE